MKKLKFSDSKKIVIKIGTSTITNDDGFDKEFLVKLSIFYSPKSGIFLMYIQHQIEH